MIRHLTIAVCDACGAEMRTDQAEPVAVIAAVLDAGWSRRLSGRLLCPGCTERASCAASGHDYGTEPGAAWKACACEGGLPAHSSHEPWQDPTTWDGCGWEWRICLGCDHIDERHITVATHAARRSDDAAADAYLAARERGEIPAQARTEDQPGDGFLAEAAAGLDLPGHQQENRENAMVGRDGRGEGLAAEDPLTAPLMERNTLTGGMPGQGKLSAARALTSGDALDTTAELQIRDGDVSVHEVAELTARLRTLGAPGADPEQVAAFVADKDALLARILRAKGDRR